MPTTPQSFADRQRLAGEYAAEIAAVSGCDAAVAQMAANSYLTYPTDIGRWGLSEGAFSTTEAMDRANKARRALEAWVAARAQRVAA